MGNHKAAGCSGISVRAASQLKLVFLGFEILPLRPPNQEMTSAAAVERSPCYCSAARRAFGPADTEGRYAHTSNTAGVTVLNIILMEFPLYDEVTQEFTLTSGDSKGHEQHLNPHTLCTWVKAIQMLALPASDLKLHWPLFLSFVTTFQSLSQIIKECDIWNYPLDILICVWYSFLLFMIPSSLAVGLLLACQNVLPG